MNQTRKAYLLLGLTMGVVLAAWEAVRADEAVPGGPEPRAAAALGELPLLFIENRDHLDPRVAYYVAGQDTTLFFTAQGVTFAFTAPPESRAEAAAEAGLVKTTVAAAGEARRWVVKLDFVGANPKVQPIAEDPKAAVISYFKGRPEDWQTGLKTYGQLRYPDLWPGIDLVYRGTVNQLKYEFELKPGADPSLIRLAYRGASEVSLTDAGQLEIVTPVTRFRDDRPVAFQEIDGRRVEVSSEYLLASDAEGVRGFGFKLGAYDSSRSLVIDPAIIVYAGYIGGSGYDVGYGLAVDSEGNLHVTGETASTATTFPETVGPDLSYAGNRDGFIVKVNPGGTGLVYAGYIGGSGNDIGRDIAIDLSGNAYVTGLTTSSDFPVVGGPGVIFRSPSAFIVKVHSSGANLVYAGFVANGDGTGIGVDGAGNAYVAGSGSLETPVVGPDTVANGGGDAFVVKLNPAGTSFVFAGYIGGSLPDAASDIAIDAAGNAYLTGYTYSTDFPATGGLDSTLGGGAGIYDAFVAKVTADGAGLAYAGYLGGTGHDIGEAITVDGEGSAYVTGRTGSIDFPVVVGPDLDYSGSWDAFIAKINAAGTSVAYAGYIGDGANDDRGFGIAVNSAGNAYVTGYTYWSDMSLPAVAGLDSSWNGGYDAFVVKVRTDGTGLEYGGYIGGNYDDRGYDIALNAAGDAFYVTGGTTSNQVTFPDAVGPDLTHNGYYDAFVAKIAEVEPELAVFPPTGALALTTGFDFTLLVDAWWTTVAGVQVVMDDIERTDLETCFVAGTLASGGASLRCPGLAGYTFGAGAHTVNVTVDLNDGSQVTDTVTWDIIENNEP